MFLIKQDLKVEGLETELQALRDCLSRIPPEDELSEEARNLRYVLNFIMDRRSMKLDFMNSRIRLKKKREMEDVLVAENCVLRAEVSRCRAKVEAMADECHAAKRRLLDETKWRQVRHVVAVRFVPILDCICSLQLSH